MSAETGLPVGIPFDARYEEMTRSNWLPAAVRDRSAGLIVAMMAIPMAMGFAMASGLPLDRVGFNAAHVIGRVAQEHGVDAIVMATRGRSRSAAVLLGSVTEEMILSTSVPLLAVKHFGARLSVLQALLDRRFCHKGGLHTD